ncbi:hypothetical protein BDR26DRAFT_891902 [Obelidium mucronatum]|nr:hypothetical protein BDR26DRAFT_891902 [Obelidium mucronatum]
MQANLKKRARISFAVECIVNELNNLPYVSGYYYLKWRVYAAGSAGNTAASSAGGSGARGITHRATVRDHTVVWNAALATAAAAAESDAAAAASPGAHSSVEVVMATDRDGFLLPCELLLVVKQVALNAECHLQEANGGRGAENVGSVTINLSELANQTHPTVKRYLLQESKVNSTLKVFLIAVASSKGSETPPRQVTISMKLIKGLSSDFKLPATTSKIDNIISLEVIRDMFSAEGQKSNLTSTMKDSETLLTPVNRVLELDKSELDQETSLSSVTSLGATAVDLSFYDESEDIRIVDNIFNKILRSYSSTNLHE